MQFVAAPVRSGVQLGSLKFKAPDGQYVWFSIEVRASEAPEVGDIDVEADVSEKVYRHSCAGMYVSVCMYLYVP